MDPERRPGEEEKARADEAKMVPDIFFTLHFHFTKDAV